MAKGNKPQTRAAAALAKGKSPVPLEPTSPMGRRSLRNTPVAEAVKRETLSHAGVGASSSKPTRRFRPNVAGAKGLRSIPEETSRVDNQSDITAMMKAVNEGDVGTPHPVESRSIEPLAQHVTPEKEVATVPTVPKKRGRQGPLTRKRGHQGNRHGPTRPTSAKLGQPSDNCVQRVLRFPSLIHLKKMLPWTSSVMRKRSRMWLAWQYLVIRTKLMQVAFPASTKSPRQASLEGFIPWTTILNYGHQGEPS